MTHANARTVEWRGKTVEWTDHPFQVVPIDGTRTPGDGHVIFLDEYRPHGYATRREAEAAVLQLNHDTNWSWRIEVGGDE